MAMHFVKQAQKKQKVAAAIPYKSKPDSLPVAEDTEKAERVFGRGDTGGRYNMILVCATRAYDLTRGAAPMIELDRPHAPTAIAMLEVEAGKLTRDYVPKFVKPKAKAK